MSLTSNSRSAILDSVGVYKFIVKEGTSEGFALISDDIRYPYVLAYSPQGSLADTLYNEGLDGYSDGYYDQVGLDFDNNKKLLKVEL